MYEHGILALNAANVLTRRWDSRWARRDVGHGRSERQPFLMNRRMTMTLHIRTSGREPEQALTRMAAMLLRGSSARCAGGDEDIDRPEMIERAGERDASSRTLRKEKAKSLSETKTGHRRR